jgi:uncharacterized membrane protein YeiH
MPILPTFPIIALDYIGVAVFAATGALVASRKQMDLIGFGLLATLTGVGGGTVRDLVLDRTVFWLADPSYLVVCLSIALLLYFTAHLVQRRYIVLLWMDALGLAAYGVLGAQIATVSGVGPVAAIVLGVVTATFGGTLRDVVSQETPLILQQEIYATAALAAACVYVALAALGAGGLIAAGAGTAVGFAVRAGALIRGWQLPRYRQRPGRDYGP